MPRYVQPEPTRWRTPKQYTVSYLTYDVPSVRFGKVPRSVPYVRMSGSWLQASGIRIGDKLTVTVGKGMMLLSVRGGRP